VRAKIPQPRGFARTVGSCELEALRLYGPIPQIAASQGAERRGHARQTWGRNMAHGWRICLTADPNARIVGYDGRDAFPPPDRKPLTGGFPP